MSDGVTSAPRFAARKAFSLVELLVVITIIAVLVGLLLPVLQRTRESARTAQCLANLHSLGIAWRAYAADNEGIIVPADTAAGAWVGAGNTDSQCTTGGLFKYLTTASVYNCPSVNNESNTRSYSINWYFGAGMPFHNVGQLHKAAETFVFIEEFDPRGFNMGSFVVPQTGPSWVDFPAHRHGGGSSSCLNFADGHAECWKFTDPRTLAISGFYASTPNNPDLVRLQGALGF